MKTSIATVSISGSFREKLAAISAAGFDGIEIFEQDFIADPGSPRDIGAMIRDMGLDITLFQPFRDFEGLSGAQRVKAFERARRKFDVMNQLGTDLILVCSSLHPDALGGIDRLAQDFHDLGDLAAQFDVRVGYEALAWGKHISDHRDVWKIVRRAGHSNVGVILDSFHTLARKIDPNSIQSIPGDKIFFVQLADAPQIDMDLLYWSRHFRNMPGEGDLAVTDFMRAVCATGYSGPISLEIFNDQFRGGNPSLLAKDGYRSLINLMDTVYRTTIPAIAPSAPLLPKPSQVDGIEFIEFATSEKDANSLCATLIAMGFTHVANHIAKDVALWQQGNIRIVLNKDRGGFAHSSYLAHGTGICDIGLRVENAEDTVARAKAMGTATFEQDLGNGELRIPAIRGVGGSVLHFIGRDSAQSKVWDVEFIAHHKNDVIGAGLTQVDHIAETMNYDEMLSWSLFYRAIFDMEKTPMVDVIDPDGLVRSQAIADRNRTTRFTLNGAETHRTLAGHFLADSFSGAVQHVAFACDDIFATARDMQSRGFETLPMSSNYYDDIASRFDIAPEVLAQMQDLNILMDRDEAGELFHFYSKPFGRGMFFEVVQRTRTYDGYGAPNAPFRIAAQKRLLRSKGIPKL